MRTAFAQALMERAERDPDLWVLTGDLGFSVFEPLAGRHPERFLNVGVAEQNMVGVAAGLASCGKRVVVYSIVNFATMRCLEQIRNDVCHHGLHVIVAAVGGGLVYGPQGYTHHGVEDLAVMRALPGMRVVAPGDPAEARAATLALLDEPGPAYLRLGKAGDPAVHDSSLEETFCLGRALETAPGRDAVIISTGSMLPAAMDAAERLCREGISCMVLSMHTVKPLDVEAVLRAAATGVVATLEEHSVTGGLGSAVAEVLAGLGPRCPAFTRLGVPDGGAPSCGSRKHLRGCIPDPARTIADLLKGA